jgi:hypothetical protein
MSGPFVLFNGPVEGASLPVGLREACEYLEACMGFRTPGLLWSHFVQARAVRRDGAVERSVRFPRPLQVSTTGRSGLLPPGQYNGEMTLLLSNPGCHPSYEGGTLSPSIVSDAARRVDCEATLVLERISLLLPLAPGPPPLPLSTLTPDLAFPDGMDLLY